MGWIEGEIKIMLGIFFISIVMATLSRRERRKKWIDALGINHYLRSFKNLDLDLIKDEKSVIFWIFVFSDAGGVGSVL
ncbi:hypothetical protein [Bergeyella sp. RCAD1439]|uniref:hypothetical protein n=1 Tax=Bergeyella anatis TaxID=3113737 RepID=UPI002E180141|nr:hypothetical protein [Bergeyella sp. RCAD1439]